MAFSYLMALTALAMAAYLAMESSLFLRLEKRLWLPPTFLMDVAMLYFFFMVILFVLIMAEIAGPQAPSGNPHCMGFHMAVC